MGVGRGDRIEDRGHIIGFKEELARASIDEERFLTWFNDAASAQETWVRGDWDFSLHVAGPAAAFIREPHNKAALEIGYGGGRILAAAARHFKKVIGIDIHGQQARAADLLLKHGVANAELRPGDGGTLPVESESVDLVYSFIVLQHVEKIGIFKSYVQEAFRVLKPGGVAVLYFGRYDRFSNGRREWWRYWLDRVIETVKLPQGYREVPARVNESNLWVSFGFAKAWAVSAGFEVRACLVSAKTVPDGWRLYGGQHGLVLYKPEVRA